MQLALEMARPAPPYVDEPQSVRRAARGGRTAVMRSEWTDPADIRPNAARSARKVTFWRAYCPLRRLLGVPNSRVTGQHVMAADKLRELVDIAATGLGGGLHVIYVAAQAQPRMGLTPAETRRAQAARRLLRLWQRFHYSRDQQRLLYVCVLENRTVRAWCKLRADETGRRFDPEFEKGLLLGMLEQLADYFATEIRNEVNSGRRLAP